MKRLLLLLVVAWSARAEDAMKIHAFVDTYYAWNANDPQSHDNFVPGTGTTAPRANEFNLNLAAIELTRDPSPLGFHITLIGGNGAGVLDRHIYQASVLYKASDRLTLEAGIFPSHIGFEGFFSKDNWSYTRGWLGEFSPYYQTGVHASLRLNDHWSGELHVLNGWQIVNDNNNAKAIGGKIAYSNDRLSASLNTFDGPELPKDDKDWRHFGDLIAQYKATKELTVGGSFDVGHERGAYWRGAAGFARYAIDARRALAVRVERFSDPHNRITGTEQRLREATLTYEHRPVSNLILKVEARRDHSTAPVFMKGASGASRNETLVIVSAVAVF